MSGISSKIMNLKFMQRHKNQVEQQQKAAADATKRLEAEWTMEQQAAGSSSSAAPSPAPPTRCGPATTAAAAAMPAARASPAAGATPPARRVVTVEDVQANEQQALLQFKPGRRSFGSFNPRLEKRLTEIEEHKREAAATMESERRAAEARKQQAAEHGDQTLSHPHQKPLRVDRATKLVRVGIPMLAFDDITGAQDKPVDVCGRKHRVAPRAVWTKVGASRTSLLFSLALKLSAPAYFSFA